MPFAEKLVSLLSVKPLNVSAKAIDLQTEDERVFCDARILTDLRPVFGSDSAATPEGLTIVHILKLGYDQGGERHRDFYVALNADDLQTLRKVIDRAEAKAKSLKNAIRDFRYIGRS